MRELFCCCFDFLKAGLLFSPGWAGENSPVLLAPYFQMSRVPTVNQSGLFYISPVFRSF